MSPYTEIEARLSRVGTNQRHFRLQRPLRGATDVVLVPSADRARTYVFAVITLVRSPISRCWPPSKAPRTPKQRSRNSAMALDHRGKVSIRQSRPYPLDHTPRFESAADLREV